MRIETLTEAYLSGTYMTRNVSNFHSKYYMIQCRMDARPLAHTMT